MGTSSVMGVDRAALRPEGIDADALGPSDNSDSGSDRVGVEVDELMDPLGVSGEPGDEAADISVDRIVDASEVLGPVASGPSDEVGGDARAYLQQAVSDGPGDSPLTKDAADATDGTAATP